jgi:hypothetical protein
VAVLLRVAARAIAEARSAWKRAHGSSDATTLRAAFRACVLAARAARTAAQAYAHDAHEPHRLMVEAQKLDAAAEDLKARLVETVVATDAARG